MIANLLAYLRTEYKPGPGEFSNIDARIVANKLELRERGVERGRANQPDAHAKQLDEVEQEIVGAIRTYAGDAYDRTSDHIKSYAQRLQSTDISGATVLVKMLARQAEGEFAAEILAARIELERAHTAVVERARELARFRSRNRLDRPADPPRDHWIYISALIIMFVVEVVPNAVILGEGEVFGMIGGGMQAIIYAALNLGTAFVLGLFAWTNVLHRNPIRKLCALVLLGFGLVFILGLNLSLGHYRIASLTMPSSEAVRAAWQMLGTAPFAISDLKSAAMVALGIFFAFIAMWEGFHWRDPYPGYSVLDRHHRHAEDRLDDVIREKIGELKGLQETASEMMKNERSRLRDRRQAIPVILEERKRLIDRFGSHLAHLQDVGRFLLAVYRDANRSARTTNAPAHFDEEWELGGFGKLEVDDAMWHAPEEDYRQADEALETSVERLQSSFESALNGIRVLRDSVAAPEVGSVSNDTSAKTLARPDAFVE